MIRSIDGRDKYKQPEQDSPKSNVTQALRTSIPVGSYLENTNQNKTFSHAYTQQIYSYKTNICLESSCTTSINWCL